tara:strand:+ start:646 stop:1011 length:366 start_codon:yes stop_codon:yes gene_type:complete
MTKWKKIDDGGFEEREKWDPEVSPELEGVLLERKENVGSYNQTLCVVKNEEGTELNVWCPTVLKKYLSQVTIGSAVKLIYKGKKRNKSGSGMYKDFDVFTGAAPESPVVEASENDDDKLPF